MASQTISYEPVRLRDLSAPDRSNLHLWQRAADSMLCWRVLRQSGIFGIISGVAAAIVGVLLARTHPINAGLAIVSIAISALSISLIIHPRQRLLLWFASLEIIAAVWTFGIFWWYCRNFPPDRAVVRLIFVPAGSIALFALRDLMLYRRLRDAVIEVPSIGVQNEVAREVRLIGRLQPSKSLGCTGFYNKKSFRSAEWRGRLLDGFAIFVAVPEDRRRRRQSNQRVSSTIGGDAFDVMFVQKEDVLFERLGDPSIFGRMRANVQLGPRRFENVLINEIELQAYTSWKERNTA